ncbi:MAG: GIY-YIG nuclease family protein [Pseudolabrys sp.]|nr:GIY-YIG nuclease family protein [Pseudolabrys sp.]
MNIAGLNPAPTHREPFNRSKERFVPEVAGCYVLTTFEGTILYIGLTDNLRRRVNEHLDNPIKTGLTKFGRAVIFHWIETPDTYKIERTWLNIHSYTEAALPVLNGMNSPTFT